jgi:hypothetical protein
LQRLKFEKAGQERQDRRGFGSPPALRESRKKITYCVAASDCGKKKLLKAAIEVPPQFLK